MAPQSIVNPRLFNGLLTVGSVFFTSLPFIILHLLVSVCTQFNIPSYCTHLIYLSTAHVYSTQSYCSEAIV